MLTETSEAASRLCNQCGLCCNGVLFHNVRLQPNDLPQDLVKLGLRIKRKKSGNYILQPCPAYQNSQCSIYSSRPSRCRLFECQQFKQVAAGEIMESDALERIRDVQNRVRSITALLNQAGPTNEKRPLTKRCEKILAEPGSEPKMMALQQQIIEQMAELDLILDRDFRLTD